MDAIQIVIVVKNDLLRKNLQMLLSRPSSKTNIQLQGVYTALADYERSEVAWINQQVLILDDSSVVKPIQTIEKLLRHFPHLKLIVLSDILSEKYIQSILDTGAHGFLFKQDRFEDNLFLGIRNAIDGQQYLSPKAALLPYTQQNTSLNQTDMAVLELMALGYTTGEIVLHLNLVNRTIYRIRRKLREYLLVRTNEQIIEAARQNGLLKS